jgi:CheY-like chemotaxis protein
VSLTTVLLIDDEDDILDAVASALEDEGYVVESAHDGLEGLAKLRHIRMPCIVLLDLMMPRMNGWEFLEAIEEDFDLATLPVIVFTAAPDETRSLHRPVLRKPIDLDVLVSTVRAIDDQERALRFAMQEPPSNLIPRRLGLPTGKSAPTIAEPCSEGRSAQTRPAPHPTRR